MAQRERRMQGGLIHRILVFLKKDAIKGHFLYECRVLLTFILWRC